MSVSPTEIETKQAAPLVSVPMAADVAMYAGVVLCLMVNVVLGGGAWVDGDTVAYLDISDALRQHLWAYALNASWFPLYPAVLAVARAVFHYRPQYDLAACRLTTFFLGIAFLASSVVLAASVRRLMLVRGVPAARLVPPRTLYAWVLSFAFLVLSSDLESLKPDALLSALLLFAVAALVVGFAHHSALPFVISGFLAGCGFWTKSFALPFFCMMIFVLIAANVRNRRVLAKLALSVGVFAVVAGPYIWKISADKGRFTIGDAGSLNSAWYVNGADRFNPVRDASVYHFGAAQGTLKHPAELLSKQPEITYYEKDKVYGAMPEWDDFSYWHDGLTPRFHLAQTLSAVKVNLVLLGRLVPMRLQALFLFLALGCWGFYPRKDLLAHTVLVAVLAASVLSFVLYIMIHVEGRYVAFAVAILGILFAGCSTSPSSAGLNRSLHLTVLLIAGVVLSVTFQRSMREAKVSQAAGDSP